MTRRLGWIALSIIPAACVLSAVAHRHAGGPAWFAPNYDAEYSHLLSALRFDERLPVLFVIQPATTLVWLYAAVIAVSHAAAPIGSPSLVDDVWRYPDVYIGRIHVVVLVLLFAAAFAGGVLVWRKTNRLASGVAVQAGLILLAGVATSAGMIWPESMLAIVGVAFAATLALFVVGDCTNPRLLALLGVLGGLGLAAKITFAVVALVPAAITRSFRHAALYLAALAATAAVIFAPVWSRIPHLLGFVAGFSYRTGVYGGSSERGFDVSAYLHGASVLVRQNKLPVAVILLSIGVLLAVRRTAARSEFRALAAATAAEALLYVLLARQPYGRYLIPAAALMGVNLVVIERLAMAAGQWRRAMQTALAVGLALCSAIWLRNTTSEIVSMRADTAQREEVVAEAARLQTSGAALLLGPWASSPATALANGQYWAGNDWWTIGEQLYPGQLFLGADGTLLTWKDGLGPGWDYPAIAPPSASTSAAQAARLDDFLEHHQRVIVQGDWNDIASAVSHHPGLSMQTVRRFPVESLVELRPR